MNINTLQNTVNSTTSYFASSPDAIISSPSKKRDDLNDRSLIVSPESCNASAVVRPEASSSPVALVNLNNLLHSFHKIREETSQISDILLTQEATCVNQRVAQLRTIQKRLSIGTSGATKNMESLSKRRRISTPSGANSVIDVVRRTKSTYEDDDHEDDEDSVVAPMIPLTITTTMTSTTKPPCSSIVSNDENDNDDDNDSLTTTSACSQLSYDDDDADDEHISGKQHDYVQEKEMSYMNQIQYEKNIILMKAFRMKKMSNLFNQMKQIQDELFNEMEQII